MRLQLSLAAQDLPKTLLGGAPNPFAVVIDASSYSGGGQQQQQQQQQQQLLGQTEVLKKTCDADWTKLFYIENWDFGKPRQLVVTIYNGKQAMSTVLFEVGDILGAPGSRLAKQLEKDGKGIVVAHVEEATSAGILKFQLRGWNLVNVERGLGLLNKSDPFFELQRWHASARAWDVVFRSAVVNNDLEPLWNESYVEVHALSGGRQTKQKFRLAMYDDNGNGKRKEMGHVLLSVHDMVSAVNPSALSSSDCVNEVPGFTLTRGNREMGKVLVAVAEVTGAVTDDTQVNPPVEPLEEVEDIVGASSTSRGISVENEEEEIVVGKPNFVAYVSGGCELRVVVAIDATASNGNPRKKSSLHYFRDNGRNTYEEVLFSLCSTLSKYDSDQKYPVFGFGAKQGSGVSHCFPMGSNKEVEGVDGILDAYRTAFRSGIVMSSPRIFSEVIRRATQDARELMKKGQNYSVLLIFTNGAPADTEDTLSALKESCDAPLSIVVVGVGEGSFAVMQQIQNKHKENAKRDNLRFVHYEAIKGDQAKLSEVALDNIPEQLETFFVSNNIFPQPPKDPDEIAVEPYHQEDDDIEVPVEINESGQATVTAPVKVPDRRTQFTQTMKEGMQKFRQARQVMRRNRRMIGQIKRMARKYINF